MEGRYGKTEVWLGGGKGAFWSMRADGGSFRQCMKDRVERPGVYVDG